MDFFNLVLIAAALVAIYFFFKLYIVFLDYYIDTFSLVPHWVIWVIVIFFPPFLILVISAFFRNSQNKYQQENHSYYDTGVDLYLAGDFQAAQQSFLIPALRGNSDAMLLLSIIYVQEKNNEQAFHWARKAYETNPKDDAILLHLAQLHFGGIGTAKDFLTCRALCKKIEASTLGSPGSNITVKSVSHDLVARTYLLGNNDGWDDLRSYKNIEKAITFFELSGQSGYLPAYERLGDLLITGDHEVPKNIERGVEYLKIAAKGGCMMAPNILYHHFIGQTENPLRFHQIYLWGKLLVYWGVNNIDPNIDNIRESLETSELTSLDFEIKSYIEQFNEQECHIFNEGAREEL